jgi:hypothetical protein
MKPVLSAFLSVLMMCTGILAASLAPASIAAADPAGDTTDPVTGYRCVSQGCFTVRLPNADCICVKRNPGETDVNKVALACSTKEDGRWVACPVKPRYGIPAR